MTNEQCLEEICFPGFSQDSKLSNLFDREPTKSTELFSSRMTGLLNSALLNNKDKSRKS